MNDVSRVLLERGALPSALTPVASAIGGAGVSQRARSQTALRDLARESAQAIERMAQLLMELIEMIVRMIMRLLRAIFGVEYRENNKEDERQEQKHQAYEHKKDCESKFSAEKNVVSDNITNNLNGNDAIDAGKDAKPVDASIKEIYAHEVMRRALGVLSAATASVCARKANAQAQDVFAELYSAMRTNFLQAAEQAEEIWMDVRMRHPKKCDDDIERELFAKPTLSKQESDALRALAIKMQMAAFHDFIIMAQAQRLLNEAGGADDVKRLVLAWPMIFEPSLISTAKDVADLLRYLDKRTNRAIDDMARAGQYFVKLGIDPNRMLDDIEDRLRERLGEKFRDVDVEDVFGAAAQAGSSAYQERWQRMREEMADLFAAAPVALAHERRDDEPDFYAPVPA